MGTTGYCMGGPMTMRTAAAHPDRVMQLSMAFFPLATSGESSP